MQLHLRAVRQAHVAQRHVCPRAVIDRVEGDHAQLTERLPFPVPGERDVLRRIDRQHLANGRAVTQTQTNGATDARLELGSVQPRAQTLSSPKELENELMQNDVTNETAEDAYLNYLEKLDKVANLEIRAMFNQVISADESVLHVFGRSRSSQARFSSSGRVPSPVTRK